MLKLFLIMGNNYEGLVSCSSYNGWRSRSFLYTVQFFILNRNRQIISLDNDKRHRRYSTKYSKQIFPEKELQGLSSISTFMCLSVIYISPPPVSQFCYRKICGNISFTDTWMWKLRLRRQWGRAIPFLGIHKWDFRCSVNTKYACVHIVVWRQDSCSFITKHSAYEFIFGDFKFQIV